ncbi:MAG: hypothetical protein MZV64_02635 [Ignavibacteriales bacterium]|nr:hypothetical protein [Ignavibacteriales bacterium]
MKTRIPRWSAIFCTPRPDRFPRTTVFSTWKATWTAHIKSSLFGPSLTLIVTGGKPAARHLAVRVFLRVRRPPEQTVHSSRSWRADEAVRGRGIRTHPQAAEHLCFEGWPGDSRHRGRCGGDPARGKRPPDVSPRTRWPRASTSTGPGFRPGPSGGNVSP